MDEVQNLFGADGDPKLLSSKRIIGGNSIEVRIGKFTCHFLVLMIQLFFRSVKEDPYQ